MLVRQLLLSSTIVSLAAAAAPQVQSQLVVEGDTPWGIPSGEPVISLGRLTRNDDGYGVAFQTGGTSSVRIGLWGSCCNDVFPYGFREKKSLTGFDQLHFEGPRSYCGSESASYSALGMLGSHGPLDSVRLDDTLVAIEGRATPAQTWWPAQLVDMQRGASEGLGLFQGAAATVVLRAGDVLPGTGGANDLAGLRDVHLSGAGSCFVALIETVEPC